MNSHEIDFKIIGHDVQLVEVELDPEEIVIAEAGAMLYMEDGIEFQARMGDGSNPRAGFFDKLLSAGSRLITGESLFLTHFSNRGWGKKIVAFSAPYPGTIIPLNLPDYGGRIIVQKDAFLCAAYGTKISITFNRKLGSGFFGGEGFILQQLDGDGKAFIHAGGTVIEKQLNNETLRVDTGCIVGFETSIDYSVEQAGGLRSMVFGGEGIFLATLRGTGKVWLQSMPIRKLIAELSPGGGNTRKEARGGLLDNLLEG
ncbi:TIGR00266 family protein [Draconibacterium halophilum]|uniref:TIGR00266 family protein n=1 Tax=Draconibacterium halophilum TaxID=2706887 RepID=A0A6C0RC81_9BACT|nr:TIGR00266 family protein [Draconibacterium halophilum]QIA07093.1 TIGR00266 family protein [Draconibacterium halophilum]